MEPNHNNYGPPAELPQPQENTPVEGNEQLPPQPETRAMQPPATVPSTIQQPLIPLPTAPTEPVNTSVSPVGQTQLVSTATTLIADDTDLIEKEWVIKAKAIVAYTKDDPHMQNREMTKMKADYLKKRYNKDLKLSEN
jgi:hypothetical protein